MKWVEINPPLKIIQFKLKKQQYFKKIIYLVKNNCLKFNKESLFKNMTSICHLQLPIQPWFYIHGVITTV